MYVYVVHVPECRDRRREGGKGREGLFAFFGSMSDMRNKRQRVKKNVREQKARERETKRGRKGQGARGFGGKAMDGLNGWARVSRIPFFSLMASKN
jgi:hypothetical protein